MAPWSAPEGEAAAAPSDRPSARPGGSAPLAAGGAASGVTAPVEDAKVARDANDPVSGLASGSVSGSATESATESAALLEPVAVVQVDPPRPAEPAWARLSVEHETIYDYGDPVEQAQHIACLRPLDDALQQLHGFEMLVDPIPSQHSTHRDSHGNSRAYFALHVAHQRLRVVARSEVTVHASRAVPRDWRGPTCGEVRERLRFHIQAPFEPASEFGFASPLAPLYPPLRAYAMASLADERPLFDGAMDLMHRIHRDFAYAPSSTDVHTSVAAVFSQRKGVCQDFAHLMLSAMRSCGLAARYVSGYLLTRPPPGQAPLVGADASHAWVSVWVPGLDACCASDWLELDPTNDVIPAQHHVRVAWGRDFGDVTPLRGVIRGGGAHRLTVHVTTRLLQEGESAAGVSNEPTGAMAPTRPIEPIEAIEPKAPDASECTKVG